MKKLLIHIIELRQAAFDHKIDPCTADEKIGELNDKISELIGSKGGSK
jgi:hypothetical protein